MRALTATGDPAAPVALSDVDEPVPQPDEAVVAVEAFSPNRGEILIFDPAGRPRPGKDISGKVVKAAQDGTGPAVGQRVLAHLSSLGWAERAAVRPAELTVLPDAVPTTTAAALPLAGLTALRLTRVTGPLASRSVLLTGASGGVGHYFTELAAAQGARVTAVVRGADRGARLLELGAENLVTDVTAALGPFDIGIDSVGGTSTAAVLVRLTERGTLIWMGQAGGTPPTLDFFDFTGGGSATIRKFAYADSETADADDLATLVRLTAGGRLHPEVGVVADWSHAARVITDIRDRRVRGNAVLTLA